MPHPQTHPQRQQCRQFDKYIYNIYTYNYVYIYIISVFIFSLFSLSLYIYAYKNSRLTDWLVDLVLEWLSWDDLRKLVWMALYHNLFFHLVCPMNTWHHLTRCVDLAWNNVKHKSCRCWQMPAVLWGSRHTHLVLDMKVSQKRKTLKN